MNLAIQLILLTYVFNNLMTESENGMNDIIDGLKSNKLGLKIGDDLKG
jgi:hypothetical protein